MGDWRRRPGAVRILNRIATVTSGGLHYEADQRHAEILMKDVGVGEGSKGVTAPGSNSEGGQDLTGVIKGDRGESRYMAVAARGNYRGWICSSLPRRSRASCPSRRSKTGGRRKDWQGTSRIIGESC